MWQNRGMSGQAIKLFMITPHVNDQIKSNSSLLNTDKRSVLQTVQRIKTHKTRNTTGQQ